MLHKLFAVAGVLLSMNALAQTGQVSRPSINATPPVNKSADTGIDYKAKGAPMPALRVWRVEDTAHKIDQNDDRETASKRKKHRNNPAEAAPQRSITTGDDVDNGANLFVMMFNPTCSHCQDETDMIEKNMSLFKKSHVVLLANPMMKSYVPDFIKQLHINDYPRFTIGIDSSGFLEKVFLYRALPQINIYDADRKLLKIYSGEAPIDSLREYIE